MKAFVPPNYLYGTPAASLQAVIDQRQLQSCLETLREVESLRVQSESLIVKHTEQMQSRKAVDRRYHEEEIANAKRRLRSLMNLSLETGDRLRGLLLNRESLQTNSDNRKGGIAANDVPHGVLANQEEFFMLFFDDLRNANRAIEIVCPFVSHYRLDVLQQLAFARRRGVKCILYTRPPTNSKDKHYLTTARALDIEIVQRELWHHKVAIIDNHICWEGSLNILSHLKSKDTMRKLVGQKYVLDHRRVLALVPVDGWDV